MLHYWDDIVQMMSDAWLPPDFKLRIEGKQFNLGFFLPENLVLHSFWILPVPLCNLPADFRLLFSHYALKAKSVVGFSDAYPSAIFYHTESLELSQREYRVLGQLSCEGPSPSIAQFDQEISSWKSPGCAYLLSFETYGGHCALLNPSAAKIFFVSFLTSVHCKNDHLWALQAFCPNSCALIQYVLLPVSGVYLSKSCPIK